MKKRRPAMGGILYGRGNIGILSSDRNFYKIKKTATKGQLYNVNYIFTGVLALRMAVNA